MKAISYIEVDEPILNKQLTDRVDRCPMAARGISATINLTEKNTGCLSTANLANNKSGDTIEGSEILGEELSLTMINVLITGSVLMLVVGIRLICCAMTPIAIVVVKTTSLAIEKIRLDCIDQVFCLEIVQQKCKGNSSKISFGDF